MGLSATSARGAMHLAEHGQPVELGFGQQLRYVAATGKFEITGQYNPAAR